MPAPTGAHTELWYKYEVNTNTSSPDFAAGENTDDTERKPFGPGATLSQFEGANNAVELFEPNDRKIAQLIEQHFSGTINIEFELSNPYWLESVLSAVTSTTDQTDYHEFTITGDVPLPMVVYAGYDDTAVGPAEDPGYRVIRGVVVQSATISVDVENTASVTLSAAYVDEQYITQATLDGQPTLSHDSMTFADATVDLDGSTISLVQDASLEINNNTDIIRELGTRIGVDYSPKGLVPNIDYTKIREDTEEQKLNYGSQSATGTDPQSVDSNGPVTFLFDNGLPGTDTVEVQFDLVGSFPDTLGTEAIGDPQEDLQESINRRLTDANASGAVPNKTPFAYEA